MSECQRFFESARINHSCKLSEVKGGCTKYLDLPIVTQALRTSYDSAALIFRPHSTRLRKETKQWYLSRAVSYLPSYREADTILVFSPSESKSRDSTLALKRAERAGLLIEEAAEDAGWSQEELVELRSKMRFAQFDTNWSDIASFAIVKDLLSTSVDADRWTERSISQTMVIVPLPSCRRQVSKFRQTLQKSLRECGVPPQPIRFHVEDWDLTVSGPRTLQRDTKCVIEKTPLKLRFGLGRIYFGDRPWH